MEAVWDPGLVFLANKNDIFRLLNAFLFEVNLQIISVFKELCNGILASGRAGGEHRLCN